MLQDNFTSKAGKIEVQESKKGLKFFSFNHQRGKLCHIGTLKGRTYEKAAQVLRQPEPSLTLTSMELEAVKEAGGQFVRFIINNAQTYSIDVLTFTNNAVKFYNPSYGYQLRVSLKYFQFANAYTKRTAATDNPVLPSGSLIEHVQEKQMPLFGH